MNRNPYFLSEFVYAFRIKSLFGNIIAPDIHEPEMTSRAAYVFHTGCGLMESITEGTD